MFKLKLVALGISAIVAGYAVGILALGVVEAQQPPPHASSTADSSGGGQWIGSHANPGTIQQSGETITVINASYHHNTTQGTNATHAKIWGDVGFDNSALGEAMDITRVSGRIHNPPGHEIRWRVKFSIKHKCKAEVLPDPDPPPGDTQAGWYTAHAKATSRVRFSIREFEGSQNPISDDYDIHPPENVYNANRASNQTGAEESNETFAFENPTPDDPDDPYYELALTDNTQYARLHYYGKAYGNLQSRRPEIKVGVEAEVSVPEGGYMEAWDYSNPTTPTIMFKSGGVEEASWEVK